MKSNRKWIKMDACKGCGQQFQALRNWRNSTSYELSYYQHCFDECEKYKKLNLIQTCCDCNRRFLNHFSLKKHCEQTGHTRFINDTRSTRTCFGCHQQFDSRSKLSKHCIECEGYKK